MGSGVLTFNFMSMFLEEVSGQKTLRSNFGRITLMRYCASFTLNHIFCKERLGWEGIGGSREMRREIIAGTVTKCSLARVISGDAAHHVTRWR